ncbi:MAG TPA: PhzF family phenazine biosynthesis protein [Bacteroidales bacterium]|nr:PhzF family phenazine biosynthesis protein [Bacteroidales bacterium]
MTFYLLDVFGNSRYTGNQLAVFSNVGDLSSQEMQQIAREINFSETTFITDINPQNEGYPVRIFTPGSEVEFAGHPTLGTAYIIKKYIDKRNRDIIRLDLKAGQIPVNFIRDLLWMRQNQPSFGNELPIKTIAELLNLSISDINDKFPVTDVSTGLPFTIVPLRSMKALKKARINHSLYPAYIDKAWAKGILVFCPEGYNSQQDLASRVFVDYFGIPEDPATGSATGCLAAYIVKYGIFGQVRQKITVGQGYEIGRPSELMIDAELRNSEYEINVGGKVFETGKGEWGS